MPLKPTRAGKRRHLLQVQAPTQVQDSCGDTSSTWATAVTRWASVEPSGGSETEQAGKTISGVTHTVEMRYYAGLTPKHRLLWGTRVLQIEGAVNTEEIGVEHVLSCREVAS